MLSMFNQVESKLVSQKQKRKLDKSADLDLKEAENKKPRITFKVELTEAGTQTLKNVSAQTE